MWYWGYVVVATFCLHSFEEGVTSDNFALFIFDTVVPFLIDLYSLLYLRLNSQLPVSKLTGSDQ